MLTPGLQLVRLAVASNLPMVTRPRGVRVLGRRRSGRLGRGCRRWCLGGRGRSIGWRLRCARLRAGCGDVLVVKDVHAIEDAARIFGLRLGEIEEARHLLVEGPAQVLVFIVLGERLLGCLDLRLQGAERSPVDLRISPAEAILRSSSSTVLAIAARVFVLYPAGVRRLLAL